MTMHDFDRIDDDDAMLTPELARIAAELRTAPSGLGPDFDARVMATIRTLPAPVAAPTGVWARLTARSIRLSPLQTLAAAAAIGALVFWTSDRGTSGARVSSLPVQTAAAGATRPVQFVFIAAGASTVAVVGDFNEWNAEQTPLVRTGDVWTATVAMPVGRHEYAFVVDGDWQTDPNAPQAVADDFGRPNSVLRVGT